MTSKSSSRCAEILGLAVDPLPRAARSPGAEAARQSAWHRAHDPRRGAVGGPQHVYGIDRGRHECSALRLLSADQSSSRRGFRPFLVAFRPTSRYSPRKRPTGFRSSTWSQTTLIDIIIGTASSMPPHAPRPAPEQQPDEDRDAIHRRDLAHEHRRQQPPLERRDDERHAGDHQHHVERAELQKRDERQPAADDERAVVRNGIEDAREQAPERGLLEAECCERRPRRRRRRRRS